MCEMYDGEPTESISPSGSKSTFWISTLSVTTASRTRPFACARSARTCRRRRRTRCRRPGTERPREVAPGPASTRGSVAAKTNPMLLGWLSPLAASAIVLHVGVQVVRRARRVGSPETPAPVVLGNGDDAGRRERADWVHRHRRRRPARARRRPAAVRRRWSGHFGPLPLRSAAWCGRRPSAGSGRPRPVPRRRCRHRRARIAAGPAEVLSIFAAITGPVTTAPPVSGSVGGDAGVLRVWAAAPGWGLGSGCGTARTTGCGR